MKGEFSIQDANRFKEKDKRKYSTKSNQKRDGMAILLSTKTDFKTNIITRDKE